jgi:hypothetical protein
MSSENLVAAALDPALFCTLVARDGMNSLSYVRELPVRFERAHGTFLPRPL